MKEFWDILIVSLDDDPPPFDPNLYEKIMEQLKEYGLLEEDDDLA